jgi:hypothetical protein
MLTLATEPLVSIVTPTIPGREEVLFNRCAPSVMRQTWAGGIEHVIVSDRNPEFDEKHNYRIGNYRRRSVQINEAWRNGVLDQSNGAFPWMIGSFLALGEFIGFLGDDDELLPEHVETHVQAMRDNDAVWSLSQVEFRAGGKYWGVIGDQTYLEAHLDATGIMCWKDALKYATWETGSGTQAVDWLLVHRWQAAGLRGAYVDKVTGIHHDGWLTNRTGKP